MHKPEILVSIDIEADGPIPGEHSMLSLGAAAFTLESERPVGIFKRNLIELPGATQHPDTMKFWASHPQAWKEAREGAVTPKIAMQDFVIWASGLKHKRPCFTGYPFGFDFTFVYWYLVKFCGSVAPFTFSGVDIKTVVWAWKRLTRDPLDYRRISKGGLPQEWFAGMTHSHDALEDAVEQGVWLVRMMRDLEKGRV